MTLRLIRVAWNWPLVLACIMALAELKIHAEVETQRITKDYIRLCIEAFDVASYPEILPICQSNVDYIAQNAK